MEMERADEPRLIERTCTLLVSADTNALWDEMARRLGLDTFDALVQVLALMGAFLVASADLGHIEGVAPQDLNPDAIRAVVVPWLRERAGQ